jgi:hypothetical protein
MKKQKKFTSEDQIIKAIDKRHEQAEEFTVEAERLERESKELFKLPQMIEQAKYAYGESKKKRRRAHLIFEKHLPALKRTLAAFRTDTMPFVEDNSVVLEK